MFETVESERLKASKAREDLRRARASVETREKFSGLRVKNRLVASAVLEDKFADLRFARIENLPRADFPGRWATAGVLLEKRVRAGADGRSYSTWKLGDLSPADNHFTLFLFGQAHLDHHREPEGTLWAVVDGKLRADDRADVSNPRPSAMCDHPSQLTKLGVSPDFGWCKGVRKDGKRCTMHVNVAEGGDYCNFHAAAALKALTTERVALGARRAPKFVRNGKTILGQKGVSGARPNVAPPLRRDLENPASRNPAAARKRAAVFDGRYAAEAPPSAAERAKVAMKQRGNTALDRGAAMVGGVGGKRAFPGMALDQRTGRAAAGAVAYRGGGLGGGGLGGGGLGGGGGVRMSHARTPPLGGGSESITLEEDDSLDAELDDLAALGAYARAAKVARATNGGSPTTTRGVLPGASSFRKRGAEKVVVASAGPGGDPAMLNVRGLGGGGGGGGGSTRVSEEVVGREGGPRPQSRGDGAENRPPPSRSGDTRATPRERTGRETPDASAGTTNTRARNPAPPPGSFGAVFGSVSEATMDGESRYAAEAASLKQAELARTLETLEKKDALREKAVRAFCVPVRASRCECGRVFEGRPSDACAAKGHRATAVEAKKRFFKCGAGNCGQRTTTLNAPFPARACPRCRCEDWDKACASASAERAGREGERAFGEMVATREKMLARGVEHGFTLNSEPPAQGN
jgi:minichromosome maintenance protein 10